jgi:hypothetical protein
MSTVGPVLSCVLLHANGSASEMVVDLTPSKKEVHRLLGGEVTFLGQWHSDKDVDGVVLIANRAQQGAAWLAGAGSPQAKKALNKHVLQPPFHNDKVYGDIFLMKTDEEGEPLPLTLKAYHRFAARKDVKVVEVDDTLTSEEEEEEEEDDEDEEEEDGDEGEEDEMDEEAMVEMLMEFTTTKFKTENGRKPNKAEKASLEKAIREKLSTDVSQDQEEEEEEEEEEVPAPKAKKAKKAASSSASSSKGAAAPVKKGGKK